MDKTGLSKSFVGLRGVGSATALMLSKVGIGSVQELLEYYPYRYEDYSNTKKIKNVRANESVTVKATVTSIQTRKSLKNRRLSITEAILTDETDNITAVWFNQPFLATSLIKGREYYFSGNAVFRSKLQLQSPQFESTEGNQSSVGRIVPVYSLPEKISPKRYRSILLEVLNSLPEDYDILPIEIKKRQNLIDLSKAWKQIHFPESWQDLENAKRRISFDELLILQLQILKQRELLKKSQAPSIPFRQDEIKRFVDNLPFSLTLSQKKSAWEIIQDLEKENPMNRLLQGDVGSGKTVVAAIGAYSAYLSGFQTAFLAPTEILAQQHHKTLSSLLTPLGISVSLLTGGLKQKEKEQFYNDLSLGEINIAVGTHALLTEKVIFSKLGFIVVDEQHRFGVKQRAILRQQQEGDNAPHLLSMTATPIPRTLALTLYGDLAISSITELPSGRRQIATELVGPNNRQKAYAAVTKELLAGRQAFVIYPLIEESASMDVRAATVEYEKLSKDIFSNFSVGLIHGRMKPSEKESVMTSFKNGEHHVLVSTSIVEVGIDVPNASIMLIEGAERFGLAQLHQFRGRVGRSDHQSYCYVIPSGDHTPERLEAICKHHDGFTLSELDLKFRGMGELVGTRQSGFLEMKVADPTDLKLVKLARDEAEKLLQADQKLSSFPDLREAVKARTEVVHQE